MTDVRSQLIDIIGNRFARITRANGFQTDIGLHVFNWRKTPMDPHSLPGVCWRDSQALMNLQTPHDEDVPLKMWQHKLKVEADIYFKGGVSASSARLALADLVAAVFPAADPAHGIAEDKMGRFGIPNIVQRTDLIAHDINVEQTGEIIAGAQAVFLIVYLTPRGTL